MSPPPFAPQLPRKRDNGPTRVESKSSRSTETCECRTNRTLRRPAKLPPGRALAHRTFERRGGHSALQPLQPSNQRITCARTHTPNRCRSCQAGSALIADRLIADGLGSSSAISQTQRQPGADRSRARARPRVSCVPAGASAPNRKTRSSFSPAGAARSRRFPLPQTTLGWALPDVAHRRTTGSAGPGLDQTRPARP
eukprot:2706362-Prymnesium_polylepis.1